MQTINPETLSGVTVFGSQGEKLGKVEGVYLDNGTGRAEWADVKTGVFGVHTSLIPLAAAHQDGQGLHVPYDKAQLKNSPHHDPGQDLSQQDEADLFRYYGVAYDDETLTATPVDQTALTSHSQDQPGEDNNVSGDAPEPTVNDTMTRSEDERQAGGTPLGASKVRLRKYVVTERVTQMPPVSEGQAHVERVRTTEETVSGEETVSDEVKRVDHEAAPGTEQINGDQP